MVYVEDFEDFYKQSEALYLERPLDTRYTIKYRHKDGILVLKVTDNRTNLKYKTDQQADLKKLERLSALFFGLMATGQSAPAPSAETVVPEQSAPSGSVAGKKPRRKG